MSDAAYCKLMLVFSVAYTLLCACLVALLQMEQGRPVHFIGAIIGAGCTAYWAWALNEDTR